ncbi:hypothetical protein SAMN05421693_11131 [Ectothiorhodospira magna]|uniref:Uncharacterized protein n=1 Tax=Ectothiorhodospira magna TaxID=867345 RepID=A0A1H9BWJ8_9GAMM|nr:hypothetical protein [Ectothiorhodospira magna]SEP93264.1 hypothetical protein SAMN05421693_11131 [Ectothiorhodospira magna]
MHRLFPVVIIAGLCLVPGLAVAQPQRHCPLDGCDYMPDVPCTGFPDPPGCLSPPAPAPMTFGPWPWWSRCGGHVIDMLDCTRSGLYGTTDWIARGIDGWFGDEDAFKEGRGVSGDLKLNTLWRQDRSLNTNLRLGARMDLPNLKDRAYLFFGLDNEDELIRDQPEAFSRQDQLLEESRREDQTPFTGLGYALREHIDLRAGVRSAYKIYLQARYRKVWWLSERNAIEFRETVFWTLDDRFGATTVLNYEYAYSPQLSFRWGNSGTIAETTQGLVWSSSVGVFRSFGTHRLLSLEALISGETDARVEVAEYGVRTVWRQSLHEDWLLGRLIAGYFWPREEHETFRREALAVGMGLELRF